MSRWCLAVCCSRLPICGTRAGAWLSSRLPVTFDHVPLVHSSVAAACHMRVTRAGAWSVSLSQSACHICEIRAGAWLSSRLPITIVHIPLVPGLSVCCSPPAGHVFTWWGLADYCSCLPLT